MIELYGKHFIYAGKRSRDYGLIIANVETSKEYRIVGEKSGSFVFNKAMKARFLIADKYSDTPLSFDIDIVTCDGHALDFQSVRKIEKWLFENSTFDKLYIDPHDDPFGETCELIYGVPKYLYFNCRFLGASKLEYNGGVVGFRCTLETDSMMLWQDRCGCAFDFTTPVYGEIHGETKRLMRGDVDFDGKLTAKDSQAILKAYANTRIGLPSGLTEEQEIVADMNGDGTINVKDAQLVLVVYGDDRLGYPVSIEYVDVGDVEVVYPETAQVMTVEVDSDIDGYTYPTISIMMGTGGNLSIWNLNDDPDRETKFTGLSAGEVVVIDSSVSMVRNSYSAEAGSSPSLYNKMAIKYFPRFVDGENNIVINGNIANVSVEWNNRRFL